MQDFRQLLVWKRAHAFALDVRRLAERLPRRGYADLKAQVTRASQSIVDNIVEGCGAASRPEFARFLDISIKSTSEVDYQLEFARDLGVIPHDVWKPLGGEVIELRKMLFALRRSIIAPQSATSEALPAESGLRSPMLEPVASRPAMRSQRIRGLMTDHRPMMTGAPVTRRPLVMRISSR